MQLHRVWADTDPRNESSMRVLERLGFRREGFLREHYFVQAEPQDAIVYGLLQSDWQRDHDPCGLKEPSKKRNGTT
jgi:RimJ/RimL family protein N-acetyltransferase